MGLDITAYANVTYLPRALPSFVGVEDNSLYDQLTDEWYEEHVSDTHTAHFAHAHEGTDVKVGDWVVWKIDPASPTVKAHASYMGYSAFRNLLSALVGVKDSGDLEQGDPFWEMCWMSDCEGVFSTDACKRISADFREYREMYQRMHSPLPPFDRYDDWAAAFQYAADNNGIVEYH